MISPEMIHEVLKATKKTENQITQELIIPFLNVFSVRNNLKLRNITFSGGPAELGNDIEYYELFGPD